MRDRYKNTRFLLCLLLLFSACVKHEELDNLVVIEGEPATITFSLGVEANKVETRSAETESGEESKVYDIIIFVFDIEDGKKVSSKYIKPDVFGTELSKKITISSLSGSGKIIIGIANVTSGIMSVDIEELLSVQNINELTSLVSTLQQETIARGRGLLMSGGIKATEGSLDMLPITIPIGKTVIISGAAALFLKRVDAKVTFKVDTKKGGYALPGDNTKWISNAKFISDKWKVVNCGKSTIILNDKTKNPNVNDAANYFTSNEELFVRDNAPPLSDGSLDLDGVKFSFYIQESDMVETNKIPTTNLSDPTTNLSDAERYSLRTKRNKIASLGDRVQNGDFIYANKFAPYVEFSGTLNYDIQENTEEGKRATADKVTAKVTYQILLGYKGGNPDDYETKRSTSYTYNVTLASANNIVVEAQSSNTDNENQSGVEGGVAYTKQSYEFDSHYDSKVITFTPDDTQAGLGFMVATPYERKIYNPNDEIPIVVKDYKWIYFKLNDKVASVDKGVYKNTLAKYPINGAAEIYTYDNIDSPPKDNAASDVIIAYNTNLLNHYMDNGVGKLIDIKHLARILSASRAVVETDKGTTPLYDKNKEIKFTAFINEFYYDKHPITGDNSPVLWKSFVGAKSRVMGLVKSLEVSHDSQSTYLSANIEFSQRSIQTMYSTDADNTLLKNAYGSESIDNTSHLEVHKKEGLNSILGDVDGLSNTKWLWGVTEESSVRWDKYVDSETNTLNNTYNKVEFACMSRNRDNNGNGMIDPDEVRWYLAAINQLTDMWIGENSLHIDSHLFKYRKLNGGDFTPIHNVNSPWGGEIYMSSSQSNWYDYKTLWSSEGSSVGSTKKESWMEATKFFYRCLRNLGNGEPQKIASFSERGDGTNKIYRINLGNLDRKSIRNYKAPGLLLSHTERSLDNHPYYSFEIMNAIFVGTGLKWKTVFDNENKNPHCPEGWRPPNQREFALMVSVLPNVFKEWSSGINNEYSFCSSKFSLNQYSNGTSNDRPGFWINDISSKPKMILASANGAFAVNIRCVRDN